MSVTNEQLKAALAVSVAVSEVIRERKRIPEGELYAVMCGQITLDGFSRLIDQLRRAALVKIEDNELVWIGPVFHNAS